MNSVRLKKGDNGPRVRELHERLRTLGFGGLGDGEVFDDATSSLVEAFQRSRGLALTGEVDDTTWQRLVEAGWHLGGRLLFLTRPYLRGDDVADLQVRLSQLGFDPGRIDGVFGPRVHEALADFQSNCGIDVNGTLTRQSLSELLRVTPSVGNRTLISELRDRAPSPSESDGPLLVRGESPLIATLTRVIPHCLFDESLQALSAEAFAAHANALRARAVVAIVSSDTATDISLHYWASYTSHSRQGERLASGLGAALANSTLSRRLSVSGMALPILRETRMTTMVIEHPVLSKPEELVAGDVICRVLNDFFSVKQ